MVFHHFTSMIGETNRGESGTQHPVIEQQAAPPEQVFLANVTKHVKADNIRNLPCEREKNLGRVSGFAVGIGSLYLQEALGYPFIVLRRQCQVNHSALKYHVQPFSLFRVMSRIHHRQGSSVFWKGWGSSCVVNGVTLLTEVAICELLRIPRSTADNNKASNKPKRSSKREIVIRETLKGLSLVVTLPIYSAALSDIVQSLALDEQRGVLTFLKDAFQRLIGRYQSRGHGRLLPFYSLVLPTLIYHLLRYSVKSMLTYFLVKVYTDRYNISQKRKKSDIRKMYYAELVSNLFSSFLTDVILYPFESVIVRLHIQGTRTIIDDLDKGIGVVPICTNYDGVRDCVRTVRREEGFGGLYKGFGALMIQYFLQAFIVKASKPFYRIES